MCNLSQYLYQEALQFGIRQGEMIAAVKFSAYYRKENSESDTVKVLMAALGMTLSEAQTAVELSKAENGSLQS